MTQPALSRAIRSLESAVGADLLIRGPHGVEPTSAGKVLLDETRGIGARIQTAVRRAQAASLGEERLRLAAQGCDVAVAADLAAGFRPAPSARTPRRTAVQHASPRRRTAGGSGPAPQRPGHRLAVDDAG